MSTMPTTTERIRPFVPTKDFDLSKRFYEAIGFEKVLDGEVAIFNAASGGFILQRHYRPGSATLIPQGCPRRTLPSLPLSSTTFGRR